MDTTQGVLNLYKEKGETPLKRIDRFKEAHPKFKMTKMTYAGRLDPLAEGVLVVLYGDKIKNKSFYLKMDKKYEVCAILGVETDTYDLLGKITNYQSEIINIEEREIKKKLKNFVGKQIQQYPPYSSKTVQGKTLFDWAKEGRLKEITIPSHEIEIYDIQLQEKKVISREGLLKMSADSISMVRGDFRQEEIKKSWKEFFLKSNTKNFVAFKFLISCGHGTYVRSIVHSLGERLKTGGVVINILRTEVGQYRLTDSIYDRKGV